MKHYNIKHYNINVELFFHTISLDMNERTRSEFATQSPVYNWKKLYAICI